MEKSNLAQVGSGQVRCGLRKVVCTILFNSSNVQQIYITSELLLATFKPDATSVAGIADNQAVSDEEKFCFVR